MAPRPEEPDACFWANLLKVEFDLTAYVDPFEKDEESARKEKEWQAIQDELHQFRTRTHPKCVETEHLRQINEICDVALNAIEANAAPRVPPEERELQDAALSLAREVGMEGLTQLQTILDATGGVGGLEELISRSACVETLLKDNGVNGTQELVSRSACVNNLLREGGLENTDELRHAVSMVGSLRRDLGLANDTLEDAVTFVDSALAIRQSSHGDMAQAKKAVELAMHEGEANLVAAVDVLGRSKQAIDPQNVKDTKQIVETLDKVLKVFDPADDHIVRMMAMAKQAGGALTFIEKATAFNTYTMHANLTVWDAIQQVNEISQLIDQAGAFKNLKATMQALAKIGNPNDVLERVEAIDQVKAYVAQHLDQTSPDKGHGQALRNGGTPFLLDTLYKVLFVALNNKRVVSLRSEEREVDAEGQEAEWRRRFLEAKAHSYL